MFSRSILLTCSTLLLAGSVACAPDSREAGADSGTGPVDPIDASLADASAFVDSGPLVPDGGGAFTVYVHTKDTLYTMDPTTFDLTLVGPFNAPGSDDITDLAVAADGTIYVISKTKLYRVDATSGQATFVATLSSGPTAGNVGLTFLPSGDLLATDKTGGVRSINPATGLVHEIGTFSNNFRTAGDLVAVEDGTMYAISDHGPDGAATFTNNWLIKVNPSNAVATQVGQIGAGGVFGAAFIHGKVLVFTKTGQIYEVDPSTGAGTLKATHTEEFWGAGVTPLVPGPE